ncbi:MAG: hypothetical protein LAP21_12420 [Acidobacteriia bacterium]|nr:hypothetical protein [Terriglobia bacterium]
MNPLTRIFAFPHSYEVKALESYSLAHPLEKLHHFPAELEEGDRTGVYLRVVPKSGAPWIGFFALGFDSPQVAHGVFSCPDADSLCVAAGGYCYIVSAADPRKWEQVEQRPVVEVRAVPELKLLLFTGFTSVTAFGEAGKLWTTERLSWEGLTIAEIKGGKLFGTGWDALKDKDVAFEVDLLTGKSVGGARPQT